MKENEAKTKWCPFSGNPNNINLNKCIGSECMMWRWHLVRYNTIHIDDEVKEATEIINEKGGGYCGLAQFQYGGRP